MICVFWKSLKCLKTKQVIFCFLAPLLDVFAFDWNIALEVAISAVDDKVAGVTLGVKVLFSAIVLFVVFANVVFLFGQLTALPVDDLWTVLDFFREATLSAAVV